MTITDIAAFFAKWRGIQVSERRVARAHFIDLCDALRVPRPSDLAGDAYCFDPGGGGSADVWYRDHFAWQYRDQFVWKFRAKPADMEAACQHLLQHIDALEQPPFLVICDGARFAIRTNIPNTEPEHRQIDWDDLMAPLDSDMNDYLRNLWLNPEAMVERHLGLRFIAVGWVGRHCVATLNDYDTFLCGPAIDIRIDPHDPATSIFIERSYRGRMRSLWVKDTVPLGTAATIVEFCELSGVILCQQATVVGG